MIVIPLGVEQGVKAQDPQPLGECAKHGISNKAASPLVIHDSL
jgi:hypothetical protein